MRIDRMHQELTDEWRERVERDGQPIVRSLYCPAHGEYRYSFRSFVPKCPVSGCSETGRFRG